MWVGCGSVKGHRKQSPAESGIFSDQIYDQGRARLTPANLIFSQMSYQYRMGMGAQEFSDSNKIVFLYEGRYWGCTTDRTDVTRALVRY